jgi:hypothetical protein
MERLIRLLDRAEDSIVAAAFSLRRKFARRPRERRKIPRSSKDLDSNGKSPDKNHDEPHCDA